jgi:hypothetical protein
LHASHARSSYGFIWMASALQSSVAVASRTKCGVAFIK